MPVSIVSLESSSRTKEDTRSLWQPQKTAVSCPSPQRLVLRVSLSTQRQWRPGLGYQAAWEDDSIFSTEDFHCCHDAHPGQVPPQQPTGTPSCFWIISHVHHPSGQKENMLQKGHASNFFFYQTPTILSSIFQIKCLFLCFGADSYRSANPKTWFIHLCPSLPPIAKQVGDALTTAARGSSEHNRQNYLARSQVVHHTDKQLPVTFFCLP